jgi:phosphopantothenoylcysteine synthetase/decarboxylase
MKKRILITGGATWVNVDQLRIITNIFTGNTALDIAKYFTRKKAKVTLLVNPHCLNKIPQSINTRKFFYFDELNFLVKDELTRRKYDVIIHSAAVSDYQLSKALPKKIPSGKANLSLNLKPTPKIIKQMRRLAPQAKIVQFKLEYSDKELLNKALKSLKTNKADFVIANAYSDIKTHYKSLLISKSGVVTPIRSKPNLASTIYKNLF